MRNAGRKNSISTAAVLVLFGIFAVCVLSVVLSGAQAFRRITLRDAESYDRRTSAQFIAAKINQAPSPDDVGISSFGEGDAIIISETIENESYITRIYCHDGWLMELFTAADGAFAPEDGEQILPAQSISVSEENGLLSVSITHADGEKLDRYISLRGGEGEGK